MGYGQWSPVRFMVYSLSEDSEVALRVVPSGRMTFGFTPFWGG